MTAPLSKARLEVRLLDALQHDAKRRAGRPVEARVGRTVEVTVPFTTSGSTYGLAIAVGAMSGETAEQVIERLVPELDQPSIPS